MKQKSVGAQWIFIHFFKTCFIQGNSKGAIGCYSENSFMALSWIMQSRHAVVICELLKFYYVIQQVFIMEVYTRHTSKCISYMETKEFCLKAIKIDIDKSTLHRQFWKLITQWETDINQKGEKYLLIYLHYPTHIKIMFFVSVFCDSLCCHKSSRVFATRCVQNWTNCLKETFQDKVMDVDLSPSV